MKLNETRTGVTPVSAWRSLLERETREVDRAGVQAAVVVIHLAAPIDLSDSSDTADHSSALQILQEWLRPTDRAALTSEQDLAVLMTPTAELAETVQLVHDIDALLAEAGFEATCSFAQRRPDENLVTSWGRAQAELDRALFGGIHGGCLAL